MLLVQYTLIFASVLALVALGGMFAERSGVINLGLEGIMVVGALAGSIVSSVLTKASAPIAINVITSILASIVAGWGFSMLLGVACITFKADQTLVGTALNIISTAFAVVVARMYTKTPSSEIAYVSSMFKKTLDLSLSKLIFVVAILLLLYTVFATIVRMIENKKEEPILKFKNSLSMNKLNQIVGIVSVTMILALFIRDIFGKPFDFKIEVSCFLPIMLVIVILSYIFLFKTKFGMRLMSCGEHPQAAGSVGINVYFQRYLGVSISGILAGVGGFAYVIQSAGCWDFKYGVAGFGFLALAVMIFGQWKPVKILLAALIFGLCQTASILYAGKFGIPQFVYKMLPYVVCMVVLVMTSRKSYAPKAEGQPYDKGQR